MPRPRRPSGAQSLGRALTLGSSQVTRRVAKPAPKRPVTLRPALPQPRGVAGAPPSPAQVYRYRAHELHRRGIITAHQRDQMVKASHAGAPGPLDLLASIPLGLYAGGRALLHDTKTLATHFSPVDLIPGVGLGLHYAQGQTGKLAEQGVTSTYESFRHPGRDPWLTAFNAVTLLGTGLGGVAKLGGALERRGAISSGSKLARMGKPVPLKVRSPAARAGQEGGSVLTKKMTSHMPLRKGMQLLAHHLLNKVPERFPHFNEADRWARAARHVRQPYEQQFMSLRMKFGREYQHAVSKLNEPERIALNIMPHDMSPEELLAYYRHSGEKIEPEVVQLLQNPKVRAAYHNPSKNLIAARDAAKKFSGIGTHLVLDKGWMTAETAHASPYRMARLAAGGKYEHQPLSDLPQERWSGLVGRKVRPTDRRNIGKVVSVDVEKGTAKVFFHNKAQNTKATVEFHLDNLYDPKAKKILVGGEAAFTTKNPFYAPMKAPPERVPNTFQAMKGGGKGVPAIPIHQSQGIIAELGKFIHGEDIQGPEFLRKLIGVYHDDLHNELLRGSPKISRKEATQGKGLPDGWEYVRRRAVKSPETIPASAKTRAAYVQSIDQSLQELIPNVEKPMSGRLGEGFSTKDPAEAATTPDGKFFYIAPTRTIKNFTGEFTRGNKSVDVILGAPTKAWRSIILGYRPGFFTNNLLGNALMYAMHIGPIGGLRPAVDMARGRTLSRDFYEQRFPEHLQNTFGSTQRPRFGPTRAGRTAQKVAKYSGQGIIPATQAVAETGFRRGIIHSVLAKSPEVRRIYKDMPKQTRDFEQAAHQAIDQNPDLARHVSQRVNDALGDYGSLGQVEKRVIRQVVPFYAWYRTIATITAKMPFETPGRALILAQLSKIGYQMQQDKMGAPLESWVKGAIALGASHGDIQRVLTTQGINPYATINQLVQPGGELSTLNPFLQGIITGLAQKPWERSGWAKSIPWLGYPLEAVAKTAENLPFAQFGRGPSALYPQRGLQQQVLSFFGAPIKNMSMSEEHRRAGGGTTTTRTKKRTGYGSGGSGYGSGSHGYGSSGRYGSSGGGYGSR